ncbi:MAG: hypothetical protein PVS2B2_00180 [Candidatus Acidiferrum sp.]
MRVLSADRLIQAKRMPQLRNLAWRRALSEHLFHRIARNDMDEKKHERENEPEGRKRERNALEKMTNHHQLL